MMCLTMPPTPAQALHCLLRMSELKRRFDGVRDKTICSLVSVSGGVGVSYLTVNLALAFHRLFQKRTALVELDLQAAPLAVLLNLEPEHTISELADPTSVDRLDSPGIGAVQARIGPVLAGRAQAD